MACVGLTVSAEAQMSEGGYLPTVFGQRYV